MRFLVTRKMESDEHYYVQISNRIDENRYILTASPVVIRLNKDAMFSSGDALTPADVKVVNKEWFDSIQVGSEFDIRPRFTLGPPSHAT